MSLYYYALQNAINSPKDNDSIIKNVWKDDWSNITFTPSQVEAYGQAMQQQNANDPIYAKYLEAKNVGYSGSFEEFKKRSRNLGYVQQGLGILSGIFNPQQQPPQSPVVQPEKDNTLMWVIGGGVVIVLSIIAYKVIKK